MLIITVITAALAGLRLWGETSEIYKSCAHVFVGGLIGSAIITHGWYIILLASLLTLTEVYMAVAKYFPGISPANILKLIFPAKK